MMTCEELSNLERGDTVYQLSTVYHEIDELLTAMRISQKSAFKTMFMKRKLTGYI